jgi:Zn-dependent protease with chaperone function
MPFLLMIFLTLVCLPELRDWPAPWGIQSSAWSISWTLFIVAFVAWNAWRINHQLVVALSAQVPQRSVGVRRYERQRFVSQILLLVGYMLTLVVFGWGWTVGQFGSAESAAAGGFPGSEVLLLAPFLLAQLLCWTWDYDADRALHPSPPREEGIPQTATTSRRPRDGRIAYVIFQARQKLALVFLPVLLLIFLKEALRLIPRQALEGWEGVVDVIACLMLLAVFVTLPWMVRFALGLRPLPDGPIRSRLLAASRRLGFRCSGLLLWNTRSGMANAMVIGIIPWIRYVVFTDRLLEEFTPQEVEAVFGHEVGHVKHQHMLYYFGFLLVSFAVLGALGKVADVFLREYFGTEGWLGFLSDTFNLHNHGYLAVLPMIGVLLSYIFVVFGFLSRRCERQADIFGCKAVSCTSQVCLGHPAELALPRGYLGLCPTGIHTFISALEKVAVVNGINRDKPGFLHSWQHSTIGRRVMFLQQVLVNPQLEQKFQSRVRLVKWALFITLSCTLAALYATNGF